MMNHESILILFRTGVIFWQYTKPAYRISVEAHFSPVHRPYGMNIRISVMEPDIMPWLTEVFLFCTISLWRPNCARKQKSKPDLLRKKRGLFYGDEMSKLPEKAVLDGSKIPKTTTGEMKEALGELHDYLKELLGEDSGDKESARLALGIDLEELSGNIDAKADRSELSSVAMTGSYDDLKDKPDLSERGVPIGTVAWFAMPVPPAGYLKCDGAAVGRETCPELFAAIGTTFGAGDGETTFNLPDLIGRFAEGSATPGTMKEAGLPNIKGVSNIGGNASKSALACGALKQVRYQQNWILNGAASDINDLAEVELDASLYNPTYGKSDTVQPPALTLLPCIKAFDAAVDSGLIDITELANEMAGKADTNLSNLSATGKAKAAHLAMPSDHLIELNYVSGETYTAPADGYFAIVASTNDGGVRLENISLRTVSTSIAHRTWGLGTSIAVRKGDRVYADGFQATVTLFGFLYAEGSQP